MPYLICRHKVADFAAWKPSFDDHLHARKAAGFKGEQVLRSVDDPNEVVLLFEVTDLDRARELAHSEDVKNVMQKGGVIDTPDFYFLEPVEAEEPVKPRI